MWAHWSLLWLCPDSLNPSLPQPVKFPGWKMYGRVCKLYFPVLYHIYFECYAFWWKSFHMPVRSRKQKGLMVSNCTLLMFVFKWHPRSEGVNETLKWLTPLITLRSVGHLVSLFLSPTSGISVPTNTSLERQLCVKQVHQPMPTSALLVRSSIHS